jgi:HK97 family phage portal protein
MPPRDTLWNRLGAYLGLGVRTDSLSLPPEEWRHPTDRFLWCEPSPAYLTLYKGQPAVRTVVDFLADNLAQLGLHVFRRLSDTDRVRVHDHPLQRLINKPNEATTRYRLMRDTVADLCIYGHAYWLKRLDRDVLLRLPPEQLQIVGGLVPLGYVWAGVDREALALRADEVVHFSLYQGRSPLETLRRRLEEDEAAVGYRTLFWHNGARLSGWLGRPAAAPRWTLEQREQFREEWRAFQGASNAGKSPVLEDGMEYHAVAATAQDSQLVQTRKLTREEVAAAYHVPPAMVGITEAQGYGSLREQHKALYQDTLGPWTAMLEDDIELQLLSDFADSDDIYVEFNIAAKLSGSFEEQAVALNSAVGSPWMTRNEARARVNLPAIPDPAFDQPVTRLDLAEGQAAQNAAPAASVPGGPDA